VLKLFQKLLTPDDSGPASGAEPVRTACPRGAGGSIEAAVVFRHDQTNPVSTGFFRDFLGMRPGSAFGAAVFGTLAAVSLHAAPTPAMAQTEPQTPAPAPGEPQTVERNAKGPTAKNFQVGVYVNVQPDCTSGTLPAIRLVAAPANGTVSIKRAKVTATNYKQCLALEVPAFIAFYQSKADFVGTDAVIVEIKYPQGRTELQRIKIEVGGSAGAAPAKPAVPGGRAI
jgi:hypothetical protein